MIITQNPDREYVDKVRQAIKEAGGYCPCRLEKNKDTRCICKDFRDQIDRNEPGDCHCGLWHAELEESDAQ